MSLRRLPAVAAAVAIVAAASPGVAGAQTPGDATVVPIQITGPPAERLNLVILADGYTAGEQQEFRDDVERNLNVQWSIEPFRSYRHYFNVYRLEIVSQDSGISCDPDDGNVRRNTPLRLNFANTCPAPALARGITYGPALTPGTGCPALNAPGCTGTQQHNLFMSTYLAPLGVAGQNVQTLAIANTFTYGGIGGTQATTSGGSPQGPLISTHELGHSLGQLSDEYPYSSRDVVRPCYAGGEPGSFHHTIYTDVQQMVADQHKWWRWIGEESLSGGIIGLWEGGNTFPCGVRRPSQHSMMRWLGNYFDQVGREHMTYRITGRRNANAMALVHTPLGEVGPADVLWVETQHPKFHELTVTWQVNGVTVPGTGNSRNLELAELDVAAGDVVQVTVKDETDWVRDPAFKDGPRMTQTRQWTVGAPLAPSSPAPAFTIATPTDHAVAGDEVVFVETTHPTDRVHDVTWRLNGAVVPNGNRRNFDLGAQGLPRGTHSLSATVGTQTLNWTVDNTLPTAPRTLSTPLTSLAGDLEHNVYFGEFDMGLEPQDDQPGFVVGEFRLNRDGWFNYFGFPEQPEGTPFTFSHSGKDVKALTYGNLGTGGLSKATFEQSFTDEHPSGGFEPGYGTHSRRAPGDRRRRQHRRAGRLSRDCAAGWVAGVHECRARDAQRRPSPDERRHVPVRCHRERQRDGAVGRVADRPERVDDQRRNSRDRRGRRAHLRGPRERRLADHGERGRHRGRLRLQRVAHARRQPLTGGDDPERRHPQLRHRRRRQLDRRRSRVHRQRSGRDELRRSERRRRCEVGPVRGPLT